jgi:hypothetical protein
MGVEEEVVDPTMQATNGLSYAASFHCYYLWEE